MYARFLIAFLFFGPALKSQVWTNLVDSVRSKWLWINSTVEDTITNTIYLGGEFHHFNQHRTKGIVKYNGVSFDTLESGIDDFAKEYISSSKLLHMKFFQNKLYVFGDFEKTGKYYCKYIGRWNGTSWDTVNFKPNGPVGCADVYNNELYVSGGFDTIGGVASTSIAKFDGTQWYKIGNPNGVGPIKFYKGKLYGVGAVTQSSSLANLSYFDGTSWIPWVGVSGDAAKYVTGLTVIDSMLFVYGRFNSIAGTNCKGLAAYNGKTWYGFGSGLSDSSWEIIHNVQKINGEIYITGGFDKIEGVGSSIPGSQLYTCMAKFDGEKWCIFSPPFDHIVNGIVKYKNDLYAYGAFKKIGNDSVWGFVRWNGGDTTIACSEAVGINPSTLDINRLSEYKDMKIYPNPATDSFEIISEGRGFEGVSIKVFDVRGLLMEEPALSGNNIKISCNEWPKGIYWISISNNGYQKAFKLIKD